MDEGIKKTYKSIYKIPYPHNLIEKIPEEKEEGPKTRLNEYNWIIKLN